MILQHLLSATKQLKYINNGFSGAQVINRGKNSSFYLLLDYCDSQDYQLMSLSPLFLLLADNIKALKLSNLCVGFPVLSHRKLTRKPADNICQFISAFYRFISTLTMYQLQFTAFPPVLLSPFRICRKKTAKSLV